MSRIPLKTLSVALLAASLALPASADPYWHGSHHRHGGWGGTATALALGTVLGATVVYANSNPPAPPRSVTYYSAPPAPVPQQTWYFCNSSGQYYPYVRYCPEGWQAVQPSPAW